LILNKVDENDSSEEVGVEVVEFNEKEVRRT
jgi:hypothetical protein